MSASTNGTRPTPRPPRALHWPIGIALILVTTMSINIWVMRLAADDPSFAVEPDYYQKAVHYDDELAQRRQSAALGWRALPTIAAEGRDAVLHVRLTDAAGAPLDGAAVTVEAFAIARSATIVRDTLAAGAAGDYGTTLVAPHPGQWEVRVQAVRGAERFTAVSRVEVPS